MIPVHAMESIQIKMSHHYPQPGNTTNNKTQIEAGTRDEGKWRGRGGGWELSGDNFKVNDYNARTESRCTKESTLTKDTSTTVAQP